MSPGEKFVALRVLAGVLGLPVDALAARRPAAWVDGTQWHTGAEGEAWAIDALSEVAVELSVTGEPGKAGLLLDWLRPVPQGWALQSEVMA